MVQSAEPIRVAIVNDFEVIVAGVASMLAGHPDVEVVALDRAALRTGSVDVVLYDTFGRARHDEEHLQDLVNESLARVVVFTWTFEASAVDLALAAGASGYLSKGTAAEDLVTALRAVHSGERVLGRELRHSDTDADSETDTEAGVDPLGGAWPGQDHGLSAREAEILSFITQGMTNQEIAATMYLSINSVKSYIRTAYRKLGIARRSQAVRFGMQHGFEGRRTSAVQ